jgi:hypothetical protein
MFIKTLGDVLKSRGIISDDDLSAFSFSVSTDTHATAALFADMTALYVQVAQSMGIQTGIESL